MPITKIVVGRGKSVPANPKDPGSEWTKIHYEVEASLGPNEVPERVKNHLESLVQNWLESEAPTPETKPKEEAPRETTAIGDISTLFPDDLRKMLTFEQKESYVSIRPLRYLGSDNFSKIAAIVRNAKGEYISAGKDSYFRIPITQTEAEAIPEFDSEDLMKHSWKGKKIGDGQYARGSNAWGWDFVDNFSESTIDVLKKGPLEIDQYEFTLGDRIVQAKKRKRK